MLVHTSPTIIIYNNIIIIIIACSARAMRDSRFCHSISLVYSSDPCTIKFAICIARYQLQQLMQILARSQTCMHGHDYCNPTALYDPAYIASYIKHNKTLQLCTDKQLTINVATYVASYSSQLACKCMFSIIIAITAMHIIKYGST